MKVWILYRPDDGLQENRPVGGTVAYDEWLDVGGSLAQVDSIDEELPKVGDHIRDNDDRSNANYYEITRVERFSSFDTDLKIIVCYWKWIKKEGDSTSSLASGIEQLNAAIDKLAQTPRWASTDISYKPNKGMASLSISLDIADLTQAMNAGVQLGFKPRLVTVRMAFSTAIHVLLWDGPVSQLPENFDSLVEQLADMVPPDSLRVVKSLSS